MRIMELLLNFIPGSIVRHLKTGLNGEVLYSEMKTQKDGARLEFAHIKLPDGREMCFHTPSFAPANEEQINEYKQAQSALA